VSRRPADGAEPIILLTRIWPTAERPSLGTFVRDRATGDPSLRVVRPRRPLPGPLVYGGLLIDALAVGRRVRGVEAHMVFPTGLVGLVVARVRRVPLVVYSHGGDVRGWADKPAPIRWLLRAVARRADRVVTNSEDTARHLRQMGVEPVVIPPGIDLDRFVPTPRTRRGRVLYLGGKNPRKGYDVAAGLADTLVGPWLRDLDPAEVPALMAEHDVVLVPSLAEPFGLVAVEAIASGRWVVARDVGGLRAIVVEGVNGTLVADGDFAGALARVPEWDPATISRTIERFSLRHWREEMGRVWDEVAPTTP
jgi:glycosyltransferase involved in cell wall biosynthesis